MNTVGLYVCIKFQGAKVVTFFYNEICSAIKGIKIYILLTKISGYYAVHPQNFLMRRRDVMTQSALFPTLLLSIFMLPPSCAFISRRSALTSGL